jgi:putative ABC transport system permease protein
MNQDSSNPLGFILMALAGMAVAVAFALLLFFGLVWLVQVALELTGLKSTKFFVIMLKNIRRNAVRTSLTFLAVFFFVAVFTTIWSVLAFLDAVTTERSKDFKIIVTERWQLPSQMPFAYASQLSEGAPNPSRPEHVRIKPEDSMTWQFYGGTLDPTKMTRENIVFFFAMEPKKFLTMMDGLEELSPEQRQALTDGLAKMQENKRGVYIGKKRMADLKKRPGERMKVTSLNYRGIDLEFDILGELPGGRYDQSAVMNRDYLNDALDAYAKANNGRKHPLAEKTLNLVWLRVPDSDVFRKVGEQIETSSSFTAPAVKCETAASGVASFLDAYRDFIWGMRWLMAPVLVVCMALIISLAISISVRERRVEMAVLKVLGYRPGQILLLVLGEAVLIGGISGLIGSAIVWSSINPLGGVPMPIAFFPAFFISKKAFLWGPAAGALTALVGSIWPAVVARGVKVSEVFAKVA